MNHSYQGVRNDGPTDRGYSAHCLCGWKGTEYRGGGIKPETDMLAEYVDHRFEALTQDLKEFFGVC